MPNDKNCSPSCECSGEGHAPRTRVNRLPVYLRTCECGAQLTDADLAANADDALELTGSYGCRACLNLATQYVAEFMGVAL